MEIYKKLNAIQVSLKAPKNQRNSFGNYNYRSCEDILEAVKPLLKDNSCVLLLKDEIVNAGGKNYVKATATLVDFDGDTVCCEAYAREPDSKKGMDDSQITGATSSYARKYALNGLFAIDDNKDADSTNTHGKDPAIYCADCGSTILPYIGKDGKEVSVAKHVARSNELYGKNLCINCVKKRQINEN